MIGVLAIAATLQAQSFAPLPPPAEATALIPPADWSILPPLPWRVPPEASPELSAFVRRTITQENCPVAGERLIVEVAIFIRGDGVPRRVVPRAIDCPTVEQFAAGFVSSLARNNVRLPAGGWYRTTITFDWGR
ncbi:hypothetical protein ACFSC3_12660 [Sphingomonas floccifaciens]|uniref:TonB C-terminal domain-containing protein n=1 Tax=Sphingomonas floccifaciens TaxID=1844115 RepID=A0ABW4NGJ0_9SPHN